MGVGNQGPGSEQGWQLGDEGAGPVAAWLEQWFLKSPVCSLLLLMFTSHPLGVHPTT